jgi:hypothetical protein
MEAMPHNLFVEWQHFADLEPWGPVRDNLHAGIVAAAIWQSNMQPDDRSQISPQDFLLQPAAPPAEEKKTPSEIFGLLKAHLKRKT